MEDRYIQLKENAQLNNDWDGTQKRVSISGDILNAFQGKSKVVQESLNKYAQFNQGLKELENEARNATTNEQEKEVNAKIAAIATESKMLAEKVKGLLEILNKEADKNKKEFPKEPETRAMITQLKAITSKFASVLKENTKIQGNLHSSIRERVKRQVKIVDNKLSPDEVEALSENPQAFQELIQVKTLGKAHLKVYYGVEDIMEKYQGIQKLENSINYIMKLLEDISLMVEQQGEMLDSIEADLEAAENYLKKGTRVLEKEKKEHKSRRKRYCCILLILVIIGGVVAFPVISALK